MAFYDEYIVHDLPTPSTYWEGSALRGTFLLDEKNLFVFSEGPSKVL
jgi:hypothetical protein